MPALSTFADFQAITGPAIFTSADDLINATTKQKYLLGRFLRGGPFGDSVQGGTKIIDQIILDPTSQYQTYLPYESLIPPNQQVIQTWSGDWRFSVGYMTWSDHEAELNTGGAGDDMARFLTYKNLSRKLESTMWASVVNGMEAELFALPDFAQMEASTGRQPYSIPASVNECTNTLFFNVTDGGGTPTGKAPWTTVEGIDPSARLNWQNQIFTYDGTAANGNNGLPILEAFDKTALLIDYAPLPVRPDVSESNDAVQDATIIVCSQWGYRTMLAIQRRTTDIWMQMTGLGQLAVGNPVYKGMEVIYCTALDTAALYPNVTAANGQYTTESGGVLSTTGSKSSLGPRYFFLQPKYIRKIVHARRYFMKKDPMNPDRMPFNWIQYVDIWHQNLNRCRNRNAIVYPSVTNFTLITA